MPSRMGMTGRDFEGFEFTTLPFDRLTPADRAAVIELFDACYVQANHDYLEQSLKKLRFVSLAKRDEKPCGFAVADTRVMDLPRLPQQVVNLAGLSCILPEFRRHGLFVELELRASRAGDPPTSKRFLVGGRMAHPAAFRTIASFPTAVPKRGVPPTRWQQEVGRVIADAYGVDDFDATMFICKGSGKPIGYPNIEVDVKPEEWEAFAQVDRDRGDSLLGIAWVPDAPPGWQRGSVTEAETGP